jgi:hypothetical protein
VTRAASTGGWARGTVLALALTAAIALAACGGDESADGDGESSPAEASAALPTGSDQVDLDPAEFTTEIDNPHWPMSPGSRWVYREEDPEGTLRVVVTVTDRTKTIANGVEARVVHDVVSQDGEPVEVTDDWYAQDAEGNVWYLGEQTAEYEDGEVVSREGSFEAGSGGAQAGVIMPADPQPGLEYRQEYLQSEAEDFAQVLGTDATVEVPFGRFEGALRTRDTNPLEKPPQVENKFYARGIGPVLTIDLASGAREELVAYTPGA